MSILDERERAIRRGLRKEKRARWKHITELITSKHETVWLEFWAGGYECNQDFIYIFGRKPSDHLRRHVRIEVHYLRQPDERKLVLEQMFALIDM